MNRRHFVAVSCLALLPMGVALAAKPLIDVPLKWKPRSTLAEMGPLDISGPLLKLRLRVLPFTDTREQPALVAENQEKKVPRQMTTSTNVAEFVTQHVTEALGAAGLTLVEDQADFTLSTEIRRFFVTETDQYRGEMTVFVRVRNKAGAEVWSGIISGAAENFGRSYKADNYHETISDMILRTSHNLLVTPSLRSALLPQA